jgi:hypothetical protein
MLKKIILGLFVSGIAGYGIYFYLNSEIRLFEEINQTSIQDEVVNSKTVSQKKIEYTSPPPMVQTTPEKIIVNKVPETEPPKEIQKSGHQIHKDFCKFIDEPKNLIMKDNLGHKNDGLNFPKSKMYQEVDMSKDITKEVKVSIEGINPPKGYKIQYAFCEGVSSCQGDKWFNYRVGNSWQNSNTYTIQKKEGARTIIVDFKVTGGNPEWSECAEYRDNEAEPNGHFRFVFIVDEKTQ